MLSSLGGCEDKWELVRCAVRQSGYLDRRNVDEDGGAEDKGDDVAWQGNEQTGQIGESRTEAGKSEKTRTARAKGNARQSVLVGIVSSPISHWRMPHMQMRSLLL